MKSTISLDQLEAESRMQRYLTVRQSHLSGVPHLGSCLSCTDILVALYWRILNIDPTKPEDPDRDRFILSKGHAAPVLFQVLARKGFFDGKLLEGFNEDGSLFGEHPPAHGIAGIEAATGSLGHGLPMAVGLAMAGRLKKQKYRTVALLSDGECNEGSTWEAALMGSAQNLENLVAIVDFNKWQATGRTEEILLKNSLAEKWRSFGWSTSEIDGHNMGQIVDALEKIPNGSGKPIAIIAHTVKGKGISFMEDDNNWHYRMPSADEVESAKKELRIGA